MSAVSNYTGQAKPTKIFSSSNDFLVELKDQKKSLKP